MCINKVRGGISVLLSFLISLALGGAAVHPIVPGPIVFTHVNVVPMDREMVLQDRDVVVQDGRISAVIASGSEVLPSGARVIDGQGKYLLPGLIDAHVHLKDRANLNLYLLNGVTTVRNMRGTSRILRWRKMIEHWKMLGPTLVTSSPTTLGEETFAFDYLPSPEAAREAVGRYAAEGYDLVKVYRLPGETYQALIDEAQKLGLPVSGHYPALDRPLQEVLRPGLVSIEHLNEFFYVAEVQQAPDSLKIPLIVDRVKAAGISVVTAIGSVRNINRFTRQKEAYLDAEMIQNLGYFAGMRDAYRHLQDIRSAEANGPVELDDIDQMLDLLYALQQAGVNLALGTDANSHLAVAGYAVHDELDLYREAGLTAYEALRAATFNAARVLQLGDRKGTVTVGKDADLALVEANPLADHRTLRQPYGVMVRGKWLDPGDLRLLWETR